MVKSQTEIMYFQHTWKMCSRTYTVIAVSTTEIFVRAFTAFWKRY